MCPSILKNTYTQKLTLIFSSVDLGKRGEGSTKKKIEWFKVTNTEGENMIEGTSIFIYCLKN